MFGAPLFDCLFQIFSGRLLFLVSFRGDVRGVDSNGILDFTLSIVDFVVKYFEKVVALVFQLKLSEKRSLDVLIAAFQQG